MFLLWEILVSFVEFFLFILILVSDFSFNISHFFETKINKNLKNLLDSLIRLEKS